MSLEIDAILERERGAYSQSSKEKPVWRNETGYITCPGDNCQKECDDTCPIFLNTTALGLAAINHHDKAVEVYKRAVEIAPDFAGAWNNMGASLGMQGKYEEAKAAYIKAYSSEPKKKFIIGIALACWDLKEYSECLKWCDEFEVRNFWNTDLRKIKFKCKGELDLLTAWDSIEPKEEVTDINLLVSKVIEKHKKINYANVRMEGYASVLDDQADEVVTNIYEKVAREALNEEKMPDKKALLRECMIAGICAANLWENDRAVFNDKTIWNSIFYSNIRERISRDYTQKWGLKKNFFDSSEINLLSMDISLIAADVGNASITSNVLSHQFFIMMKASYKYGVLYELSNMRHPETAIMLGVSSKPGTISTTTNTIESQMDSKKSGPPKIEGSLYCNKCGKKIPTDSLFCPYCSNKVVLLEQDYSQPINQTQKRYTPEKKTKPNHIIRNLILFAAMLIVIIGLIVYSVYKPSAYKTDSDKIACWVKYIGNDVNDDNTLFVDSQDEGHYDNEMENVRLFSKKGDFHLFCNKGKISYLKFISSESLTDQEYQSTVENMFSVLGNCDNDIGGVYYWDGNTVKNKFKKAGCDICFCYMDGGKLTIIWAISDLCTDLKNITPPSAITASNGEVFVNPSYEKICPFKVITETGSNYYIYLKYIRKSNESSVERKSTGNTIESDLAFYVIGGKTVEIDVPVGVYKLYYSSGDLFYGPDNIFGHDGYYSKAEDLFEFYVEDGYACGNTVTLYPVTNGNMDTTTINNEEFPR